MKYAKIFLIVISAVWTIINLYKAITSPNVVNLTSFLGIIPIFSALYSEIDWIYISCNKIKAYFFLKTVKFTPKSSRYIDDGISITKLEKSIRKLLKDYSYKINEAFIKITDEDLYIPVISVEGLNVKLTINIHQESSGWRLTLKSEYQIAYRDVSKCWNAFLKIRDELFSESAKTSNSKDRYDVTINTDNSKKYNPFYRLTIKNVGKPKVQSFNLKFTDENLSITTNMHKIYGSSKYRQDIEKMIKDYVPLSKIL